MHNQRFRYDVMVWIMMMLCMLDLKRAYADTSPIPSSTVEDLLQRAYHATVRVAEDKSLHYVMEAVLQAGNETGSFTVVRAGATQLETIQLGLRTEITLYHQGRVYRYDQTGLSRELNGSLLAHERTAFAIESGEYLRHPEWASQIGTDHVDQAIHVTAPGGESLRVVFDAQGLPQSIESGSGATRASILESDWRWDHGRRRPYWLTLLNAQGERLDAHVQRYDADRTIDPAALRLPPSKQITAAQPSTVQLVKRDDHLYVPVEIRGHHYEFLLDSGSQLTVFDQHVVDELHLQPQGAVSVHAAKQLTAIGLIEAPPITIGGATLPSHVAVALDLGTTSDGSAHIDGILGAPFFAQAEVVLDARHASLELAEPASFVPTGVRWPTSIDRGVPEIVAACVQGPSHARFVLDTGNASTVLLYQHFAQQYPHAYRTISRSEVSYGVGGETKAAAVSLLGLTLPNVAPLDNLEAHVMMTHEGCLCRYDASRQHRDGRAGQLSRHVRSPPRRSLRYSALGACRAIRHTVQYTPLFSRFLRRSSLKVRCISTLFAP